MVENRQLIPNSGPIQIGPTTTRPAALLSGRIPDVLQVAESNLKSGGFDVFRPRATKGIFGKDKTQVPNNIEAVFLADTSPRRLEELCRQVRAQHPNAVVVACSDDLLRITSLVPSMADAVMASMAVAPPWGEPSPLLGTINEIRLSRLTKGDEREAIQFAGGFLRGQFDVHTQRDEIEHGHRVSRGARLLAKALKLDPAIIHAATMAGLIHDIGLALPTAKRTHAIASKVLLEDLPFVGELAEPVGLHHAHWDGSGEPADLKGENIPIVSRLLAVSDAMDVALFGGRVYSGQMGSSSFLRATWGQTMGLMKKHSGTKFDPRIIEAMGTISEERWNRYVWSPGAEQLGAA